jgi:Rv2525c-like, glycoside hydrolase-like domain
MPGGAECGRARRLARQPAAALAGSAAIVALVLTAGSAPALAQAESGSQSVSYAGYHFAIPATWPVFDLSRQPMTCVRFDLHAVYLGSPASNQTCPSWLLGATEALVIGPGPSAAGRRTVENPVSHLITATAPGLVVTATFDTDPAVITGILASAGLATAVVTTAARAGPAGASTAPSGQTPATELAVSATAEAVAAATVPAPPLPAAVANDVGLGFDTCTAPSSDVMQAWLAGSPYRAVGIYIGGADRACSQPNLTADWVRQQAVAGWHFIPLYAGPQSAFGQITAPAQQGTADATDAAAQAEQLGFGPGTPLYCDMESYLPAQSAATLEFLSSWTAQLHKLGYDSGVYSSSNSGIADLAAQYGTGRYAMPDVIYDALWNGAADVNDGHYQAGEWASGQRIHQFSGNVLQTYGGASMQIDQDYLDVAIAPAAPSPQPSSAVPSPGPSSPAPSAQPSPAASPQPSPAVSPPPPPAATAQASAAVTDGNGSTFVFAVGPGHHLIEESMSAAGQWTRTDLGGYLTSAPSAVLVGSVLDVFYRGAGHRLWERTSTPAGFGPGQRFGQFGPVGAPEAVAQPDGVIDVFWRAYGGSHLWHAQYDPGSGWAGPQNLQGHLASDPYPVVAPSGDVQVFWTGAGDRNLWRVVRGGMSGTWRGPEDLGMGPLSAAPQAVALASGEVDVFWRRLTRPRFLEMAVIQPGRPASGPVNPGGALGALLQPWPVVADGSEWLVFQGRLGGLRQVRAVAGGGWTASAWVRGVAGLLSAPFAAAGPASAPLEIFWTGTDGHLWAEQLTRSGGWGRPVQLGPLT